jgi:hypothetical protein
VWTHPSSTNTAVKKLGFKTDEEAVAFVIEDDTLRKQDRGDRPPLVDGTQTGGIHDAVDDELLDDAARSLQRERGTAAATAIDPLSLDSRQRCRPRRTRGGNDTDDPAMWRLAQRICPDSSALGQPASGWLQRSRRVRHMRSDVSRDLVRDVAGQRCCCGNGAAVMALEAAEARKQRRHRCCRIRDERFNMPFERGGTLPGVRPCRRRAPNLRLSETKFVLQCFCSFLKATWAAFVGAAFPLTAT